MTPARYTIFVDAGYLLAAGGWATVGTHKRAELRARGPALLAWMKETAAAEMPGRELLRVYWYDAALRKEPTSEQLEIAREPDTKLRLGSINAAGVQKGVDALVMADMVDLAASQRIDTAYLVAGDEDFVESAKRLQAAGVRLTVWAVDTPRNTVSVELRREADRCRLLSPAELKPFFGLSEAPKAPVASPEVAQPDGPSRWQKLERLGAPSLGSTLVNGVQRPTTYAEIDPSDARAFGRTYAEEWLKRASDREISETYGGRRPLIPYPVDAPMLVACLREFGLHADDQVDSDARIALRGGFWDALDNAARSSLGDAP